MGFLLIVLNLFLCRNCFSFISFSFLDFDFNFELLKLMMGKSGSDVAAFVFFIFGIHFQVFFCYQD